MNSYIKTYFKIISWRIFVICMAIAMVMTSLFPFDDVSMSYIFSKPVIKVMLKTFVIGGLLLTIVNVVAFHVFRLQLWETNVLHASFYHTFFGVILPFIGGVGLIRFFYGPAIFQHGHVNSDLMLMLLLLVLCNALMVIRMYAFYLNKKNVLVKTLKDEHKDGDVRQKMLLEKANLKHREELDKLKSSLDRINAELKISLINADKYVAQAELRERQLTDEVDRLTKQIVLKSTALTHELDQHHIQQLAYILLNDRVSYAYDPLSRYQFADELNDRVINEEHVAFIFGANREGVLCQDIYLLDGEVLTVYESSLEEMNRIFPRMVRISRNHLIPGKSVVSYEVMSSKLVKVKVRGQEESIEMKHEYIKKVFSWIILQYVWNQYREKQSSPAVSI
ncbi:hypothetical protein GEO21_12155 [Sphingobacterium faecium]|uniref:hypothetical protein n=1 Tax=Sphingobacterium faecium TaxID=34087 RepID=UPI001290D6A2|nr:hypothetical protein [Sphingobacterium faecium]MQP28260.1 hypothetical protein [Sphingobacterium faecium]